jgi:hypothetical protein
MRWRLRLGSRTVEGQKGWRGAGGRGAWERRWFDGAALGLRASSGHTSAREIGLHF